MELTSYLLLYYMLYYTIIFEIVKRDFWFWGVRRQCAREQRKK